MIINVWFFAFAFAQQPFQELQHGESFSPSVIYSFKKMDRKYKAIFLKKPFCSTILDGVVHILAISSCRLINESGDKRTSSLVNLLTAGKTPKRIGCAALHR